MIKKFMTLMLIGFTLNLFFYGSTNANDFGKEAKHARKVKSEIVKLGSGKQSVIKIKLRDKTELSGYIGEIGENEFTVIEKQTGKSNTVSYSQVKKARGNNYSTGQKILIGVGLFFAAAFIIGVVINDDF